MCPTRGLSRQCHRQVISSHGHNASVFTRFQCHAERTQQRMGQTWSSMHLSNHTAALLNIIMSTMDQMTFEVWKKTIVWLCSSLRFYSSSTLRSFGFADCKLPWSHLSFSGVSGNLKWILDLHLSGGQRTQRQMYAYATQCLLNEWMLVKSFAVWTLYGNKCHHMLIFHCSKVAKKQRLMQL